MKIVLFTLVILLSSIVSYYVLQEAQYHFCLNKYISTNVSQLFDFLVRPEVLSDLNYAVFMTKNLLFGNFPCTKGYKVITETTGYNTTVTRRDVALKSKVETTDGDLKIEYEVTQEMPHIGLTSSSYKMAAFYQNKSIQIDSLSFHGLVLGQTNYKLTWDSDKQETFLTGNFSIYAPRILLSFMNKTLYSQSTNMFDNIRQELKKKELT